MAGKKIFRNDHTRAQAFCSRVPIWICAKALERGYNYKTCTAFYAQRSNYWVSWPHKFNHKMVTLMDIFVTKEFK